MTEIDRREFGRLEAKATSLRNQVASLQTDVRTLLELRFGYRDAPMEQKARAAIS